MDKIIGFFTGYKNVLLGIVAVALLVSYTVFIWRTAGSVKENDFNKERLELQAKVTSEKDHREAIKDAVGKALEEKLASLNGAKIAREIQHEIDKNPIYTSCRNTDDVVRKLKDARDSANKATGK